MNNVSLARVNSIMAIGRVVCVCVCVGGYGCGWVWRRPLKLSCLARGKGSSFPPDVQLDAFVREGWLHWLVRAPG